MALVGRALLGMTTPPPPPGSGATAFSSWVAQNNGAGGGVGPTATATSANDSSGAHPGSIAQAAEQTAQTGPGGSGRVVPGQPVFEGAAAQLTSPTGQKQTLGS